MALDFSKFIMEAPNTEFISKLPEYRALGAKTAAAATKGSDQLALAIAKTDVSNIFPKSAILLNEQREEINNQLAGLKGTASEMIKSGAVDVSTIANLFYNGVNKIKTDAANLGDLAKGTDELEKISKQTPGMVWQNVSKNYNNYVLRNPDGTPKRVVDIFSDGKNAVGVIDDVLKGYDDNYDNGAIREALLKTKGNLVEQEFTIRDKKGFETTTKRVSDVPSNAYLVKETTEGDRFIVNGVKSKFSDDRLANAFHTVTKDNATGNDIDVMKDQTLLNSYAGAYPGFQGYLLQEQRKFEKEAANNGIIIRDEKGNIKPEYQGDIDKYLQAVTYNAFDDLAPIVGGFKTKGGLPGKGDVISQKAPLPQHPSQTVIVKQQEEQRDKKIFYDVMDNKEKDTDGYISIHDQFSGIKDKTQKNYGEAYGDLAVGWDSKKKQWRVRMYDINDSGGRGGIIREMSLNEFYTTRNTTDATKSDQDQFLNLMDWTRDHTPKSGKTGKLNNPH